MNLKSFAARPPKRYPWQRWPTHRNTIGVVYPCYGSAHVIYGLPRQRYKHFEIVSAPLRVFDAKSTFFGFTPLVLDYSVSLIHAWNAIPMNRNFIVSFELELPRYLGSPSPWQIKTGMKILDNSRCRGILALSEFAYGFAKKRFDQSGFPHLVEKMSVFRGAVVDPLALGDEPSSRPPRISFAEKPLSAVVIGTALFRKGGMYAIEAFENIRARGIDVRLTLIGDFETECYVFKGLIPSRDEWVARAKQHPWIDFRGAMPNHKILENLREHDICLYPSIDESLGWLIIEAGMLGIPVLGNRLCAFPELISHMNTGWLIDLPLNADGRWLGIDNPDVPLKEALCHVRDSVVQGIEDCVEHVIAHPEALAEWGRNGREKMVELYGMQHAGQNLEKIYDDVLASF